MISHVFELLCLKKFRFMVTSVQDVLLLTCLTLRLSRSFTLGFSSCWEARPLLQNLHARATSTAIIIIDTFSRCSLVIGLFQVQISALNNSDKYLSSVLENDIIVVGFDAVCRCPQVVLMLCLLEPRLNDHYLGHPIGFSLQSSCS